MGLDVVRKNIHDLKGTIEVITEPGSGTTFRIMLPITLAILQALVVKSGEEIYAVPLASVDELVRISAQDILTVEGRELVLLREENLPLLRLSDAFSIDETALVSETGRRWYVIVSRTGDRRSGIMVDEVLRQQEIVIKPVGERLSAVPGLAGATEIGESEVVLVIDTASLIGSFGGRARGRRREVRVAGRG